MKRELCIGLLIIGFIVFLQVKLPSAHPSIVLSYEDAQRLGRKIWQNECRGSLEGLTCWNQGEEFASLGIGHCIWYPSGQTGHFREKFPELLSFFKTHHVALPSWLEEAQGAPWKSREEFYRDFHDEKMVQLREILAKHVDLQILFMIDWLNKALPRMISTLEKEDQRRISIQFHRLANTPAGIYALLDYLNFKGEGVAPNESYQGHRWGLLQVLDRMDRMNTSSSAVEQFVEAAKQVLRERVQYAPKERNEQRWLQGWVNRLETYSSAQS